MTSESAANHKAIEPAEVVRPKAVDGQLLDEPVGRAQAEGPQQPARAGRSKRVDTLRTSRRR
ncbi:hypothetical protein [Streptomyces sp. NPDC058964]|uniref:hypothetical protein n=1 Tax=Streptomyces sp. NPDC058964 TaxID=3346681 RepID=UPI0036B19637